VEIEVIQSLLFVLVAALFGGLVVRALRLPPLVGYIAAGIVGGALFPGKIGKIEELAELGIILLLFSVGLEVSLSKLTRVGRVVIAGAVFQIILVMAVSFAVLRLFGFDPTAAVVLAAGFSLSSTAVVVKILSDRGETDTIHGEIMIGWLLVQDLAVIPMAVLLPSLASTSGQGVALMAGRSLVSAAIVIIGIFFVGRLIAPYVIHKIAATNSRELLVLSGVSLALGVAGFVSFFGISPALGAFLAGVVTSESQENHAVFAETRPLRDLFVILFFVSLGFLVTPAVILSNFLLIIGLAALVMITKAIIIFIVLLLFGYHGKTNVATSIGLAQVGEFSFVLFLGARQLGILSQDISSIGIAVTLSTLVMTPILFKSIVPIWRRARDFSSRWPRLNKLFLGWRKSTRVGEKFENHIIICGYGRMGKWIGQALRSKKYPFVVIDYNQKVVHGLKNEGTPVVYGDPAEPQVLEQAGIRQAKAIVLALPDRITQEELISYAQTTAPNVKIIARAHLDGDWEKLSAMKVKKVVQPEFEGALIIIKDLLDSMGRSKEEISDLTKSLRRSHSLAK